MLSTMLGWSDARLAATLFHELAHQVVYVPGDSEFNEAFATVVEEAGLSRWLDTRGSVAGAAGVARISAQRQSGVHLAAHCKTRAPTLRERVPSALPVDEDARSRNNERVRPS